MIKRLAIALSVAAATMNGWAVDFQAAVNKFTQQDYLSNAAIGVCVMDIATGQVLASNQENLTITTASTMKTVTSSSAIEILGKDFRFHTIVKAVGEHKGNKLHGNVVVCGYGDPTLGSRYFKNMPNIVNQVVDALHRMGINKVDGRILYDESAYPFETFSDNWMIEDLAYDYGPGVHALNYSDNLVHLTFDRSGDVATDFRLTPAVSNLEVISHAVVGDEQDMYRLLNIGPHPNIILYGKIRRNARRYSDDFVNPNPAQLLCDSISRSLERAEIEVKGKHYKDEELTDTMQVLDYKSPALTEIVASLLDRSDNMFTEALLRAIAYNSGKAASAANGIDEIKKLWKRKGLDVKPLFQKDGSGLARNGRASAKFFTQMLRQVYADADKIGVSFPDLMTHLGETGNIGPKIKKSPLKGKIASKSGSMSDVQCYVGYYPADCPKYTWAILANNWHGTRTHLKEEIENLLMNLFTTADGASKPAVNR